MPSLAFLSDKDAASIPKAYMEDVVSFAVLRFAATDNGLAQDRDMFFRS